MKPERIEALLRTKPPDEPDHRVRPVLDGLATHPVRDGHIRPAQTTAGGLGWAIVLVLATIGVTIGALVLRAGPAGPSPSPAPSGPPSSEARGVIPWIDATPAPSPTPAATPDAASLPACGSGDLALVAGGWGGATGSMAGGATLINVSPNPCHIWNPMAAQLSDATGAVIARLDPAISAAGSSADVVAVPSGGDVSGIVVWMNWCDAPPKLPLSLTIYIADREKSVSIDAPALTAVVRDSGSGGSGIPRCDAPDAGSTVGPVSFGPPEPSSADYQPQPCAASSLAAFSGTWGAAAGSSYANLIVLNAGSFDCLLPTSPTLELRDAHGALLAASTPWADPPATVVLPPGWTAAAVMTFADWCTAPPALPLALDLVVGSPPALRVVQSDADAAAIPLPGCGSAPATPPPVFGYALPFSVPGMPFAPPADPVDTLPMTVVLSALPTTAPGAVLDYTVTLTNISPVDKPLPLAALCPSYVERLFLPGGGASLDTTRLLNCQRAGTLAAGASVTFEMRLTIPLSAPSGTAGITWQLGQRGPAAKALFHIGS